MLNLCSNLQRYLMVLSSTTILVVTRAVNLMQILWSKYAIQNAFITGKICYSMCIFMQKMYEICKYKMGNRRFLPVVFPDDKWKIPFRQKIRTSFKTAPVRKNLALERNELAPEFFLENNVFLRKKMTKNREKWTNLKKLEKFHQ